MSYQYVVRTADDGDLQQRIAAAAALEGVEEPVAWAVARRWKFAAMPGWADAYESAVISFIDRPGLRPGAISDAMILSAVQAVIADEAP
jgi:hypothetical protein